MANGQQLAELNFQTFMTWLASRTDSDFKQLVSRGCLSRKEISTQCGFSTSALNQNPRIKSALLAKEASLRESGVLPQLASASAESPSGPAVKEATAGRSFDAERLRRLEQENASLRAENAQLKRELERFVVIRDVLSTSGRMPR